MWKSVKQLKQKFTPQYVSMKNRHGHRVSLMQRAEAIAEYLEQDHWGENGQSAIPNRQPIFQNNGADESPFKLDELNEALKRSKNNKQPGPDGIIMELLKWLDKDNRESLLRLFNEWWINKNAPEELLLARVVPIFKKGDSDKASNYRPISLLSSFYKIYIHDHDQGKDPKGNRPQIMHDPIRIPAR